MDPSDGTINYVLGYFYFSVAGMGFATRLAAKAIFGEPPKVCVCVCVFVCVCRPSLCPPAFARLQGTYDQALQYFLAAEQAEPGFYMSNRLMLAKTYMQKGNKAEAKKWLQLALTMPLTPDESKEDFAEAQKLKRKLGL